MSVSIRYKHNDGSSIITPGKVILGKSITDVTIPALLRNGRKVFYPFGGVVDYKKSEPGWVKVKLVGIISFWWNPDGFGNPCDIPVNQFTLGFFYQNHLYIAIKDDAPIYWDMNITPPKNYLTQNVFYLSDSRE